MTTSSLYPLSRGRPFVSSFLLFYGFNYSFLADTTMFSTLNKKKFLFGSTPAKLRLWIRPWSKACLGSKKELQHAIFPFGSGSCPHIFLFNYRVNLPCSCSRYQEGIITQQISGNGTAVDLEASTARKRDPSKQFRFHSFSNILPDAFNEIS